MGKGGLALAAGGKALALLGVVAVFLLTLALMAAYAVAAHESMLASATLAGACALYLAVWAAQVLTLSFLLVAGTLNSAGGADWSQGPVSTTYQSWSMSQCGRSRV